MFFNIDVVMEEEQLVKMIDRYLIGEALTEEMRLLDAWFNDFNTNPSLTSSLSSNELKQLSSKMFLAISEALDTLINKNSGEVIDNKD